MKRAPLQNISVPKVANLPARITSAGIDVRTNQPRITQEEIGEGRNSPQSLSTSAGADISTTQQRGTTVEESLHGGGSVGSLELASITTQHPRSTEEESRGYEMSSSKQPPSDVQGGDSMSSTPDTTEEGISQSANPATPKQPTSTPQPHTTKEQARQSSGAGGTAFSSTQAVYSSSVGNYARPRTTEDVSSVGSEKGVQTTNSGHSLSSARNDISPGSTPTIPPG